MRKSLIHFYYRNLYFLYSDSQIEGEEMTSTREDYVILSEILRKINFDPSYEPSAREHKVLASLLERELKDSPKRKSKDRKPSDFEWQ